MHKMIINSPEISQFSMGKKDWCYYFLARGRKELTLRREFGQAENLLTHPLLINLCEGSAGAGSGTPHYVRPVCVSKVSCREEQVTMILVTISQGDRNILGTLA